MDTVVQTRDPIWYKHIPILYDKKRVMEFWPHPMHTFAEKANAMVRFSIYAGIAIYIMTKKPKYLVLAMASIAVISFMYDRAEKRDKLTQPVAPYPRKQQTRDGTLDNPYANPLVASGVAVEGAIPEEESALKAQDEMYKKRMFMGYDDVWDKQTGQRQFVTIPERDPGAFAEYLYKDMPCERKCPGNKVSDLRIGMPN